MSMWERITSQPAYFERIKSLYNENFPLEVRFVCAQWIEERIKADQFLDINDPQYEQRAANFMHSLIQQLEQEKEKIKKPEELPIKYRIEDAIRIFTQNIYSPGHLYKTIRDALTYEQHFLETCSNSQQMAFMDNEAFDINEKLKSIQQLILISQENCNRYKHESEQSFLIITEYTKRANEIQHIPPTPETEEQRKLFTEECKRKVCQMTETVNQRRIEMFNNIRTVINLLDEVQKIVIHKRLGKWQREQALSGNGAPLPLNALDEIQGWFESLAEMIWNTRTLIDIMRKPAQLPGDNCNEAFESVYREVTTLLQNLIVSGFIVEKQPPQVMKTNTR